MSIKMDTKRANVKRVGVLSGAVGRGAGGYCGCTGNRLWQADSVLPLARETFFFVKTVQGAKSK